MIITQSLYTGTDYFLFRPIGNKNYREIKFSIVDSTIIENPKSKLHQIERDYIKNHFLFK